jgi:hypothetical protein
VTLMLLFAVLTAEGAKLTGAVLPCTGVKVWVPLAPVGLMLVIGVPPGELASWKVSRSIEMT